jgi:transposase
MATATTTPCRKVYKFSMEPTTLESDELERTASVSRFVYNWCLERCKAYYQQYGKSKPWGELSAELTQLKRIEKWLYDFDSQNDATGPGGPEACLYQLLSRSRPVA